MQKRILGSVTVFALCAGMFLAAGVRRADPEDSGIASCGDTETVTEEIFSDYIGDDIVVPALDEDSIQTYAAFGQQEPGRMAQGASQSAIPGAYDSRLYGYVTEAKTQVDNTCWTYSAVSTAETSVLKNNTPVDGQIPDAESLDLSEEHLAYAFYHMPQDEMGNTDGDATTPLGSYTGVGGNHVFTTFGLADWYGIASAQTVADVTDEQWEDEEVTTGDYPDSVHLQQAYWINLAADQKNVKRMIMEHGSVAISMYYGNSCYNAANNAYYCDWYDNTTVKTKRVNHAVQIVGWDDTYSRSNFNSDPGIDGAWLAKNSMGTGWGDDGYFWISYDDHALIQGSAKAFVFAFESADNYVHIYQYDGSAGAYINSATNSTGYQVASGSSVANVFKVPSDTPAGAETLDAVSFALYAVSVDYSIQIYRNPSDAADPTSGEALLTQPVTGKTSFVGYYTVPLDEKPLLQAGDTFSVVVTLSKSSGKAVDYFADLSYQNGNWIRFTNQVQAGQSFAYTGGGWSDLAASGASARIKAFTNDVRIPATGLSISAASDHLWKGDTLPLSVTVTPENATEKKLVWTSSDPSVASVDEAGVVSGKKSGSATITATLADGSGISASYTVTVRTPVTRVTLKDSTKKLVCEPGKTIRLALRTYPDGAAEDSIYFTSSDEKIAAVHADGTIKGQKEGKATISVYSVYDHSLLFSTEVRIWKKADTDPGRETETEKDSEKPDPGSTDTEEPASEKPDPGKKDTKHPDTEQENNGPEDTKHKDIGQEIIADGKNPALPVAEPGITDQTTGSTDGRNHPHSTIRTEDTAQPEIWLCMLLAMAVVLATLIREKKDLS